MQCEKNTGERKSKNERQESEKEREEKRNENHATCTSLIWLLALRTMAGNKCMEMSPLTAGVCVPVIRGLADRSVLTSASDRDNRVRAVTYAH